MPQPPAYTRGERYVDYAADHTSDQYNPADHDAEHDDIFATLAQVLSNLSMIQRDDGALFNGIVTTDSLSSAVAALLAATGSTIRGAWLTTTVYAVKDVVTQGGSTYICATAHTAGVFATDLAAGKWVAIDTGSSVTATGVSFTPTGGVGATNVQSAIAEVDSEKLAKASNLSDVANRATAFSNLVGPGGTMTGDLHWSTGQIELAPEVAVPTAATIDLSAQLSNQIEFTGTTTITSFGNNYAGPVFARASGVFTITHSANLLCPGDASITTAVGDTFWLMPFPAGTGWIVWGYQRHSGKALCAEQAFCSFTATVAANALTFSVPAGTPLRFSDGTTLMSGALTLTIPAGQAVGTSNGVAARLWLVAMENSFSPELAVINTWNGTDIYEILPTDYISTTAIAAAPNAHVWYSTTVRATQGICVLGYIEITEAVAGTWATNPTVTQGYGHGAPLPGQRIQRRRNATSALAAGSTTIPYDDTIPQSTEGDQYLSQAFTPRSALNLLLIEAMLNLASSATGKMTTALFQDATANALAAVCDGSDVANNPNISRLEHQMLSGTTSSTTFKVRAGLDGANTTTLNGNAWARKFGGVATSWIAVTEIMR